MSTGKLDQSLDDILKTRRSSTRRGRGNRRAGPGRPAPTEGPVGGVAKTTKQAKPAKAAAPVPIAGGGESKIMVSNLPLDVQEPQLKEFFQHAKLGKPKRVLVQYGQGGRSLGAATVIWAKADQAAKAVKSLDGVRIDNRLIKVELLVSASNAPAAPAASLVDRVTQPKKDKPKPATAAKPAAAGNRGRGEKRGRGRGGRGGAGRNGRDKKKTVEELDAEMEDYFPAAEGAGNDAMVTNGGASGGDTNMDEEL